MGVTATGNVLANDKLPAGTTATVSGFSVAGSNVLYPAGSTVPLSDPVTGVPIGTMKIEANGTYTFDPVDGFVGPAPGISVYETSSNGLTAVAGLTIDVLPGGCLVPCHAWQWLDVWKPQLFPCAQCMWYGGVPCCHQS